MNNEPGPLPSTGGDDQSPSKTVDTALSLAHDRTRDLYLNLDQARSLAYDLADDLDFARDLSRGRDVVHAFAHARDRNAGLDLALDRARTCSATVIADLERLKTDLALAVDGHVSRGATAGSARTRESRVALRLTRLTTRCLPARHRARYREEYAAELSDLRGAPRRAQWHYALNTLAVAWKLRYELRRADRRPAPDRRLG